MAIAFDLITTKTVLNKAVIWGKIDGFAVELFLGDLKTVPSFGFHVFIGKKINKSTSFNIIKIKKLNLPKNSNQNFF